MTESTTTSQRFVAFRRPGVEARPDAKHDVWVARTEALLANFEEAAPEHVSPALGFVIMAADYLWAEQRAQASFGELDTFAFAEACSELIGNDETLREFVGVLRAFYEFLGSRSLIEAGALQRIREELQALEIELAPAG